VGLPLVTVNVAVLLLGAMLTEAGTVKAVPVLLRATFAPPAEAGWLRVTAQVVLAFAPRLPEAHCRDETVAIVARLMVAV
jgi:hypothetical protein